MANLIQKINRSLLLAEKAKQPEWYAPAAASFHEGWWKEPFHPYYSRAYAEDCLQRILGPMRPDSVWHTAKWEPRASMRLGLDPQTPPPEGCAPPPEYNPGGPAPVWTADEITIALAGDPSTPKGPRGYLDSPIMSTAKQVGSSRRNNEEIYELYTIGLLRLSELLKPGMDQARSPFRAYAVQNITLAMQNGFGSTKELNRAKMALKTLTTSSNLKEIHDIISEVQDPYRVVEPVWPATKYDKDPGNCYGHYSGTIYTLGAQLLQALHSNDVESEDEIRSEILSSLEKLEELTEMTLGTKTGVFQAINTKRSQEKPWETGYRWLLAATKPSDIDLILNPRSATFRNKQFPYDINGQREHTDYIIAKAIELQNALEAQDTAKVEAIKLEVYDHKPESTRVKLQSIDAQVNDDGHSLAQDLAATPDEEAVISTDVIAEVLRMALEGKILQMGSDQPLYNINDPNDVASFEREVVPLAKQLHQSIAGAGMKNMPKPKGLALDIKKVSTPFTVLEYRAIIRILGKLAFDYPGKGKLRKHTDIPRDVKGWWQPGEDPELEVIPADEGEHEEIWQSIWLRNGCPSMGSKEVCTEFTKETTEFMALGIESAFVDKYLNKGGKMSKDGVINKNSMSETVNAAYNKILIILALFGEDLKDINESKHDRVERQLLFEAAYKIAKMLARAYDDAVADRVVFIPEFDLGCLYETYKRSGT